MNQQRPDGEYLRRSLLNVSAVNWPDHTGRYPILYNCNIGHGCKANCKYCYSPLVLKQKRETWGDWKTVANAVELLRSEIGKRSPGRVMFCSTTEPYLDPVAARECLKILLASKHYTLIITKRPDVVGDIDILRGRPNVEVGFSITGLDDEAVKQWEPGAPRVSERIGAAQKIHDAGIKTYASVEPWIPSVTHPLQIVQRLDPIIDRWIIGAMNYMHQDHKQYLPELKETVAWLDARRRPYFLKKELQALLGIKLTGFQNSPR